MANLPGTALDLFASQPDLRELARVVLHAGDLVMGYWPGGLESDVLTGEHEIQQKGDGTLVSKADYLSNAALTEGIHRIFPGDAILSEESAYDPQELQRATRTWVIDPLDGTSVFLKGRDDFSLLVALCERNRPTVGIQYFPARDELLLAREGQGALLNGIPLQVSSHGRCREGSVYIRNWNPPRPELASAWMDSGMAFAKVARGELDGVALRIVTHREWDIAAPISIIQEAGGRVSDEGGSLIPCGTGALSCRYVIASNGLVHDELLALVQGAMPDGE